MKLTILTVGSYLVAKLTMLAAGAACQLPKLQQFLEQYDSFKTAHWLMQLYS